MIKVTFYNEIADCNIRYAVIISKYHQKWVFCKHKKRTTYECPGGHRELGESILQTAKRELYEETGAIQYDIIPIGVYGVTDSKKSDESSYGMLYFADIKEFGVLTDFEIEKIELFEKLPDNWTYPEIQPYLFEKLKKDKR